MDVRWWESLMNSLLSVKMQDALLKLDRIEGCLGESTLFWETWWCLWDQQSKIFGNVNVAMFLQVGCKPVATFMEGRVLPRKYQKDMHGYLIFLRNKQINWQTVRWSGPQRAWLDWRTSIDAAAAKSLQSCPTLCNPRDSSPPGSSIHGFSRQEYWSGLPFPSSMHESEKWKWSHSVVSDS